MTVLQHTAKGLPDKTSDGAEESPRRVTVVRDLERRQWFLWQGNVSKALQVVPSVERDLDAVAANGNDGTARKLLKAVGAFHTDIENCKGSIRNSGERYRHGERSSTGFVESTVDQVVRKRLPKKQQMPGGMPGAHLLLHTWVKTLKGELGAAFGYWLSRVAAGRRAAGRLGPRILMRSS